MRYRSARAKPLDKFAVQAAALHLQSLLRARGSYEHLRVRPHGQHLLVEGIGDDGAADVVARATALTHSTFQLDFRAHSGRWEPLPVEGDLNAIVDGLTQELGPFLDAAMFSNRT